MYPYLSNIMLVMDTAYVLSILYSDTIPPAIVHVILHYVLLLRLRVLTLRWANIYQALFLLGASGYVFPILIGILIAMRIKAECYG